MAEVTDPLDQPARPSAPSKKRKVSARELITDLRMGMPNPQLMKKYGISLKTLEDFFRKLEKAKLRCRSCGETRWEKFDECPRCGILVDRFAGPGDPVPVFPADGPPQIVISGEVADPLRGRTRLLGGALALVALVVFSAGLYWLHLSAKQYQTDIYFNPIRQELVKISRQLRHGITMIEHRKMVTTFSEQVSKLQVKLKGENPQLVTQLDESISSLRMAENAWIEENKLRVTAQTTYGASDLDALRAKIADYKRRGIPTDGPGGSEDLLQKIIQAGEVRQSAWQTFQMVADKAISFMDNPR